MSWSHTRETDLTDVSKRLLKWTISLTQTNSNVLWIVIANFNYFRILLSINVVYIYNNGKGKTRDTSASCSFCTSPTTINDKHKFK